MNFSTLTLDERERLAYAEGYTETAALLAEMADLEQERDKLQDRLDEVEFDFGEMEGKYNDLIEERDDLEDKHDDTLKSVDELGCKLHDTRAMLELSQEQAKTYKLALMALEAEVSPAIREFIREVLA